MYGIEAVKIRMVLPQTDGSGSLVDGSVDEQEAAAAKCVGGHQSGRIDGNGGGGQIRIIGAVPVK